MFKWLRGIFPPSQKNLQSEAERLSAEIAVVSERVDKMQSQNGEARLALLDSIFERMEQNSSAVSQSITEGISQIEKTQSEKLADFDEKIAEISESNSDSFAKIADVQRTMLDSIKELREQNETLKASIEEQKTESTAQIGQLKDAFTRLCDGQRDQIQLISALQSRSEDIIAEQANSFDAILTDIRSASGDSGKNSELMNQIEPMLRRFERKAAESVWAQVFNNAIIGCDWLYGRPLSPGRSAAGYPLLFAMFHALNQIKPKSILELGLGQSTIMLSRYSTTHPGTMHFVAEPDYDWISFFQNEYTLSYPTRILQMPTEPVSYRNVDGIRAFKNFDKGFAGQRFDLIVIDAPFDISTQYARIDVLRMMPACLNDNFVIIIDDVEQDGVKNTVLEMENCLKNANIPYAKGIYSGEKDCVLLTSQNRRYLTNL